MKMNTGILSTTLLLACAAGASNADIAFNDDFESGLNLWTGKNNGNHYGVIVDDPLGGSNKVLSFNGLNSAGDLFTRDAFALDPNQSYRFSFDYLGLAKDGSRAQDTGGYVGFSVGTPGVHSWMWATGNVSNANDVLIDNGQWNSYNFDFTAADLGIGNSVRLMVEDFRGSGGVSGDAFFDNFSLQAVPTPGTASLLFFGGAIALRRKRG